MAQNSDWFVAPTGARGDGSREKPFHDPWMAFRRAEPGDTIHVAAGTYYGRFDRSSWIVNRPRLTVLGGYAKDFAARTPWKTPSVFACRAGYEYARENNLIGGRDDHSGLVLDGLCFDAADRSQYSGKPGDGVGRMAQMDGPIASFNGEDVVIRNCVFANSVNGGVELSGSGSRFENNMAISLVGLSMLSLRSSSQLIERPITVKGNSFLFLHDLGDPAGAGGDRSQGVRVQCPAVIEDNVFVSCGNSAIGVIMDPERVAIERNAFFASPHSVIELRNGGSTGEIKEKNLEELEDLGFKACAGNAVQDPAIKGLEAAWLDACTRDLFSRYAAPPRDADNALRAAVGLPALAPARPENGQNGGVAPQYFVKDIPALSAGAKQGFHAVETPVTLTPRSPAPAPEYRRIEWASMLTPDAGLANARVELRVGLGTAQNTSLLADVTAETHMGVRVYDPGSDDNSFFVLVPRNSFADQQYGEARNYQRGMEVERTYWLRGIYRPDVTSTMQKATLVVESIEQAPVFAPPEPARPAGRDWFVRAGSTGGDGSREKPFRDPFQALEKAEGGDAIHVAAGDYFGKLRSGKWLLTVRYLSLLGGYDAEFTTRDPWANPTRFALDAEEKAKGRPEGTILYSEENSDGLVLDGFVFDGATWNSYEDGSLSLKTSPVAPLIKLRGLRSPVTVRNCLFLNGSDSAVVIDCAVAAFENNVIVNTSGDALVLRANGAGPAVVRNNTILFAADPTPRAGTGDSSSSGTMIQVSGRGAVTLESNVIGFADNYGVRAALPQENVGLRNNVFAANLFNHLCDCQYLFADGSNWAGRVECDSAYALEGNKLTVPSLPVDPAFSDLALARLFSLPSRIKAAEWKAIAPAIGSAARPEEAAPPAAEPPPPPAAAPASTGGFSLDALLSKATSAADKAKEVQTKKEPSDPIYCPVYDYKKAAALATEGPDAAPGAHRRKLEVSFGAAARVKPQVTYKPLNPAELDKILETLDQQPVEISVTELRNSTTNSSLFPSGTDRNDYSAYGVVAVDAQTRTRLAIVVREDTDVSKRVSRVQQTDKLSVRGTAYRTSGTSGLSILVDSLEVLGN